MGKNGQREPQIANNSTSNVTAIPSTDNKQTIRTLTHVLFFRKTRARIDPRAECELGEIWAGFSLSHMNDYCEFAKSRFKNVYIRSPDPKQFRNFRILIRAIMTTDSKTITLKMLLTFYLLHNPKKSSPSAVLKSWSDQGFAKRGAGLEYILFLKQGYQGYL